MHTHLVTLAANASVNRQWLWQGALSWPKTLRAAMRSLRSSDAPVTTNAGDAAREAAAVYALADRYRLSDPGFASDLYAAAARYESAIEKMALHRQVSTA